MKLTHWVLVLTAVALVGADIYWATNGISGDTISEVILRFSLQHPAIPFSAGFLFGHLMWPQRLP